MRLHQADVVWLIERRPFIDRWVARLRAELEAIRRQREEESP